MLMTILWVIYCAVLILALVDVILLISTRNGYGNDD